MDFTLLVMLLKDLVILPFQEIKLELKDETSKKIIKLASKKYSSRILVVSPLNNSKEVTTSDLPQVGVVAYIKNKMELSNGNIRVTLRGEKRVRIINYEAFTDEVLDALVTDIILPNYASLNEEVMKKKLKDSLNNYIESSPSISNSILKTLEDDHDLGFLTDAITTFLPLNTDKKLEYMAEVNSEKRAIKLLNDITIQIKQNELEEKIDSNVQMNLAKEQEEYYLKEKIKEIEKTLGLNNTQSEEVKKYYEKLDKLNIDVKSKEKIKLEIKKLERINASSPEEAVLRNYLDWVLNLPWNNVSKENLNSSKVLTSLNKTHYGLDSIKDKIIDYVNLKKINNELKSPVICLVGPPGVGKTTIASSIASSLNREFYKISVGGLNDSTELIGSRRTYLGALPGKIMQALRKCGTKNPVILIDEVDKMVKDYKGDPASTLLDILDTNQNKTFVDNYIEEPFDLSQVFFILTANDVNLIPDTLLDRLEVINLASYTVFEKMDIAKKYLLPSIDEEFKLSKKISIKDDVLMSLINDYTKEAGVRNLARVLKLLVTKIITSKNAKYQITKNDLDKYLQNENITLENTEIKEVGVVNALAVTNLGGTILRVEASIYPGSDDVIVTGSLGDTLKESIKVAISYIKEKGYLDRELLNNKTLHIHMRDTATKKEGPSCGVSIITVILSRILNVKISEKIAMTGEVSLKGDILRVGGLKEKLIAAYNAGVSLVYIPKDNASDLKSIPKEVLDNLKIKLVSNYQTIYEDLFQK